MIKALHHIWRWKQETWLHLLNRIKHECIVKGWVEEELNTLCLIVKVQKSKRLRWKSVHLGTILTISKEEYLHIFQNSKGFDFSIVYTQYYMLQAVHPLPSHLVTIRSPILMKSHCSEGHRWISTKHLVFNSKTWIWLLWLQPHDSCKYPLLVSGWERAATAILLIGHFFPPKEVFKYEWMKKNRVVFVITEKNQVFSS